MTSGLETEWAYSQKDEGKVHKKGKYKQEKKRSIKTKIYDDSRVY